jgi:branched-chain amino acid transport system permease protein
MAKGISFSLINFNVGLAIRAISINPVLSDILGLNSDKIVSIVFFTASALAALVGISLGVGNGLTPSMGFQYSIWAFVVAVISGLGSIRGIFTTGILFGILINFSISLFSPLMAYAIALFLVSLVLLFNPDGLFGIKERII